MSASSSNPASDDPVASTLPRTQTNHSSAPPPRSAAAAAVADDNEDSDDYTSSSGPSDSEESEEEDDDDAEIATEESSTMRHSTHPARNPPTMTSADADIPRIPAIPKPNIRRVQQSPDLLSRLSAFLPQMKTANEQLEREIAAGRAKDIRLDDVMDVGEEDEEEGQEGDGKQYIEMNLGLGVLEEKRPDGEIASPEYNDSEETVLAQRPKDSGVLDTLMGNMDAAAAASKPTIEELEK
ncbi:NOPCHAP1/New4 family protein [Aspergillus saccharolyticus JOP 1030-1]|uniref:Uncharacterized protein n=1 Tax=Aspergillus saccharolyticus JOP 1030-1 TaxID=1450539 RepID=A0A319AI88_9EURO|nr:hypothetical protein BP01DRAFT_29093 [Aspergillus saccharolyticus JOP 1030-1]PYH46342.1 hypothetical protein BP01DRAFT_29093 [Aspergillus saccharolyticus JOP 1030-1]